MNFNSTTSYGYPVLRPIMPGDDPMTMDYPGKTFEPLLRVIINPENKSVVKITCETDLRVPELNDLIKNGKAELYLEVMCADTFFKQSLSISSIADVIELDANSLRGTISTVVYLIAKENLKFHPKSAHTDFKGLEFSIRKDQVLAISSAVETSIDKEQFKNLRAILDTSADDSVPEGEFRLLTSNDYVNIQMHPKTLEKVLIASNTKRKLSVLASLFVPVIIQLLHQLASEPERNSDFKWQQTIRTKLRERDMDLKKVEEIPSYAQRLWNMPFKELSQNDFGVY